MSDLIQGKLEDDALYAAESFNFDGNPEAFPFTITIDGKVHEYVLVALNGEQRDSYLNSIAHRARIDPKSGKPVGVKDFTGLHSKLLKEGVRTKIDNKPVPEQIIQKWLSTIQETLAKKLKRMSGLDEEAEKEAKKD